ncbi:MAG TPA: dual specificity protein phosphatase family protein [Sphingomicrobium sp.]|nr:dual specificity protein phosphatase family protein [Sphingomicrobium sp.]
MIGRDSAHTSARWEPDLDWLTDVLAIGGCFPMDQAVKLAELHGIRAIVDLRSEERDDEELLKAAGITLLHLPTPDLEAATLAMLDRGVAFVREHLNRGEKVLIHCQHGIGRSPLLALCVLVDLGREPLDALALAKSKRAAVSPSRLQYEGWASWLERHGKRAPDYHSFGCIAYRHLASE